LLNKIRTGTVEAETAYKEPSLSASLPAGRSKVKPWTAAGARNQGGQPFEDLPLTNSPPFRILRSTIE